MRRWSGTFSERPGSRANSVKTISLDSLLVVSGEMTLSRSYEKLKYLFWAGRQFGAADTSCPACGSHATTLVKRKYLVTALYRCAECFLMFRVPKDDWQINREFY